jgi:hypothetical protein
MIRPALRCGALFSQQEGREDGRGLKRVAALSLER